MHVIFRYPKLSETQKRSSTKCFQTVRRKYFDRKNCDVPLSLFLSHSLPLSLSFSFSVSLSLSLSLSLFFPKTFPTAKNYPKHRRVPLNNFWYCETNSVLRKIVILLPPSHFSSPSLLSIKIFDI